MSAKKKKKTGNKSPRKPRKTSDPAIDEVVGMVEKSGGAAARGAEAAPVVDASFDEAPITFKKESSVEALIRKAQESFYPGSFSASIGNESPRPAEPPRETPPEAPKAAIPHFEIEVAGPPSNVRDPLRPIVSETMLPFDGALIAGNSRAVIRVSAPDRSTFAVKLIYLHATLRKSLMVEDICLGGESCLPRKGAHSAEVYELQQMEGTTPEGMVLTAEERTPNGHEVPARDLEIYVRNLSGIPQYAIGQIYGTLVAVSEEYVAAVQARWRARN